MKQLLWSGFLIWCFISLPVNADVVMPSERVKTAINVRDLNTNKIIATLAKGKSATYIDSIPYYYVIQLADGTRGKVAKSYSTFVEGTINSSIKIATFNIQVFGKTKSGKPEVMKELANIVRQYDVIAVQEIKDADGVVPDLFQKAINANGATYQYLVSPRTGQQPDDLHSQEQYAFYYNTATVKPLDNGALFDDGAHDLFQREPFIARFGSVQGGLTFVLITIHTRPESAVSEIKALNTVIKTAESEYPGEDDFVTLGDFNDGCTYASPSDFEGTPIRNDYHWLVPDTADTTVSTNTSCAYDRIVITHGMDADYTGKWGIGAVSNKKVSDHFPVWAEFNVGFHN